MPINFIPNDPLAQNNVPMRPQKAHKNRPSTRAGLHFPPAPPQGLFNPGTPDFLFWQCREGVLSALNVWEGLDAKVTRWARSTNPKRLALQPNNGDDLNAYYDGQSLAFFEHTTSNTTTFSAASTDVVAHETGHAILDSFRPDLWDSLFIETGAFHEAFGDCVAILTALSDQATRAALLNKAPDLGSPNFVEATAEDLSAGVKLALGANHPAAEPRHAWNTYQWQLPSTLPKSGPPKVLSSEIHSFARVFSGSFYDLIRNLFLGSATRNEAALLAAAQSAGRLLAAGTRQAPESPRFFQAVGRSLVLADETLNNGANRQAIRDAFSRHGLAVGANAMLAPRAALAGAAPKGATLSTATLNDLKRRLGVAPKARLLVQSQEIAGERLTQASHRREVPLGGLSKQLSGVVALAEEHVLVGAVAKSAAMISNLPDPTATRDEVFAFVSTLLDTHNIAFDSGKRGAVRAATATRPDRLPTHTVVAERGRKVLRRVRFACLACGGLHAPSHMA